MIWKESFEHFSEQHLNNDLIEKGLYGVLVINWDENIWTPTEITEEDFPRYSHVAKYQSEEQKELMESKAFELNSTKYPMWPLVRKVGWD